MNCLSKISGFAVLLLFQAPPAALHATSLSTPFVDVRLVDIPVGKPVAVTHSAADGLLLENTGSEPVNVRVQAFPPAATDLRDGAGVIPHVEWVQISPDHAVIPPHSRILCRVTLTIPNEAQYRDQHYQVMIWSRAEVARKKGMGMNAGLISRLRFKTK